MQWDTVAGDLLKGLRARMGLSQRALARRAGVPQSTIAEIETGRRQPSLPLLGRIVDRANGGLRVTVELAAPAISAQATAERIRIRRASASHESEAEDAALRAVIDLKDALRLMDASELAAAAGAEPILTGEPRWDAFLAAVVEDECARLDMSPPRWVNDPRRFVKPFWYLTEDRAWHGWELATAPAAYVRHGVLAAADELESV